VSLPPAVVSVGKCVQTSALPMNQTVSILSPVGFQPDSRKYVLLSYVWDAPMFHPLQLWPPIWEKCTVSTWPPNSVIVIIIGGAPFPNSANWLTEGGSIAEYAHSGLASRTSLDDGGCSTEELVGMSPVGQSVCRHHQNELGWVQLGPNGMSACLSDSTTSQHWLIQLRMMKAKFKFKFKLKIGMDFGSL